MNTKFSLLFMLVVCFAGLVSAKPQGDDASCGENEIFTTCGSPCPTTCYNRFTTLLCVQPCIVGCQCQSGFILNNEGKCILPEDC